MTVTANNNEVKVQILPPMDIRRFDIRVARVEHILQHPAMDNGLYLQNIVYYGKEKVGSEMEFKLAINGVAQYYSEESMDDKMVVVLCNPKPEVKDKMIARAKMLCAVTKDRLELLVPPPGSVEGDIVSVEGYPPDPEKPFLLPVENAFAAVSPDVRVNSDKQAVYRGIPLQVDGKGVVTTNILSDCPVNFE